MKLEHCRIMNVSNIENEKDIIKEKGVRIVITETLPELPTLKNVEIIKQLVRTFQTLHCNCLAVSNKTDVVMHALLVAGILKSTGVVPAIVRVTFNQKHGGYKLNEPLNLTQFAQIMEL